MEILSPVQADHSLVVVTQSPPPPAPAAGSLVVFGDTLDNSLRVKNSDGAMFNLGSIPASVRVYNSAAIGTVSGTEVALSFDSARQDTAGFHVDATHLDRLTVPDGCGGTYHITGHFHFASFGAGLRRARIRRNGTQVLAEQTVAYASDVQSMSISTVFSLLPGDYVELLAYQDSGVGLNISVTPAYSPEFGMTRLVALVSPPTPGLVAGWLADRLHQVDNSNLLHWGDITGNGYDGHIYLGLYPPQFRASVNGHPAVQFDPGGSSGFLQLSNAIALTNYVICAVYQTACTAAGREFLMSGSGATGWISPGGSNSGDGLMQYDGTNIVDSVADYTAYGMTTWTNHHIYRNGAEVSYSQQDTLTGLTLDTIGDDLSAGLSHPFGGSLTALLVYDGTGVRADIEAWMLARYGPF